ncbi:hypothetical protein [Streptomyces melanosporofaciens]|uniref:Uncharacterized protein n=1 Tax=Streptomyces melanosporofaciens TaxID=67327 RepID=A0A1H4IES4_STRMJ|nr:hypothetical protein [Streptomyces melanosporofaciens]SEB31762.1 hypothetical protein SAMN04490356_0505 [Streptomyces melanosporofaciens]
MTYPTEHLMDLAALVGATTEAEDLKRILSEGRELYHRGLEEMQTEVARECSELADQELAEQYQHLGAPWPAGSTRDETISMLAFHRWDSTPGAIAFGFIAEHAARHGVSAIPEE